MRNFAKKGVLLLAFLAIPAAHASSQPDGLSATSGLPVTLFGLRAQNASLSASISSHEGSAHATGLVPSAIADTPLRRAMEALPSLADGLAKRDHAAVASFYEERDFQPVWFKDGSWSSKARKLIFTLSRADIDGLDPSDYETPPLSLSHAGGTSDRELANAEIQLSLALARYVRHAYAGRVDPRIFSRKEITIKPHFPDATNALRQLARGEDVTATLRSYHPPHKGFSALRDTYNRLRLEAKQDNGPPIPDGKSLKVGMRDKRVPRLREKLGFDLPAKDADLYDKALSEAVQAYQTSHGLIADGITGRATLRAINHDDTDLIADLVANMERWRWVPRELGHFHVMVNIPTFHVQVVKGGRKIYRTRVVVGKNKHKTPVFSDEMEYLVVNPYWNVPKSIASKELLPQIKQDPEAFFTKKNYQVLASVKGRTQVIDPSLLDWDQVEASMVRLRQTPGTRNALGNIKFMFPNQHAVYLHDTPSRSLFHRDDRAYSHGCVRVYQPMEFADVILSNTANWDAARVEGMIGGDERHINLDHHIPVHLVYFTTWISDDGTLQRRPDIYGHNKKVKAALDL